jgi:hypothetical protein
MIDGSNFETYKTPCGIAAIEIDNSAQVIIERDVDIKSTNDPGNCERRLQ